MVEIDLIAWSTGEDGTVIDLSVYDFGATGKDADFEAKMADGFTKIEIDG